MKSWAYIRRLILRNNCKFLFLGMMLKFNTHAQITNYISNGSFEADCSYTSNPIYWPGIDSLNCNAGTLCSECSLLGNAPANSLTYQKARTGESYMVCTFFQPNGPTGYLKNRLKQTLTMNKTYCVKFYVNISNNSTYGIDAMGVFFVSNSIDSIKYCSGPLTYINAQIRNATGNIIIDTLQWTQITGTFVATGNEKYALIGNFKPDLVVNKTLINPINLPTIFTDVCIDDVSCIPIDLTAYAGPDVSVVPGNSVYIGRPRDVGIDEACTWYKLPITITPTTPAIDTAAGIWVSPTQTSTYVVRQQIWCGALKYDTVVVYMNPLGIVSSSGVENDIKIFPNPADDFLEISSSDPKALSEFKTLIIYDHLGQLIYERELTFKESALKISINEFLNGIYFFQLRGDKEGTVSKRFVVYR